MTNKFFILFGISKVFIIITINPKFQLPKMSTTEVIGVQSSRFPSILSIYIKFKSHTRPYMERCDLGTLCSSLWRFFVMGNHPL